MSNLNVEMHLTGYIHHLLLLHCTSLHLTVTVELQKILSLFNHCLLLLMFPTNFSSVNSKLLLPQTFFPMQQGTLLLIHCV